MIERKEMQQLVSDYEDKPTIVIFGSHSAIETGLSSKRMGLNNIVVVKKGRERQYLEEQSHLFDETIVVVGGCCNSSYFSDNYYCFNEKKSC